MDNLFIYFLSLFYIFLYGYQYFNQNKIHEKKEFGREKHLPDKKKNYAEKYTQVKNKDEELEKKKKEEGKIKRYRVKNKNKYTSRTK